MNIFIVIFTILFISLIGYIIIRGFEFISAKDNLLAIGVSYGLGVGLISMQLYLYSSIGIPWQRSTILIPLIILIAGILFKKRKKLFFSLPKIPSLRLIDKLIIFGILISILYVIFEAVLRPATAWDTWADWLLLAKIFFINGKITPAMIFYIKSVYPLTINLLGTFVYIMLGKVDDTAVLITSSAFYAYLAILFFASLYKQFGIRYALIFTFLLVSTQNFVRHGGRLEAGLADLPLGYLSFTSVILLFRYMKDSRIKTFLLLNTFLAITSLIKFEGLTLTFFIAICSLSVIYKNKHYNHILLFLVWILPFCLWEISRAVMHQKSNYFSGHAFDLSVKKTLNAFWGTLKELLNIKSWNMLWIVYFYSLLISNIKKNIELAILNFVILSQLSVYLFIYIFTYGNEPSSSIERLLMHIAPLAFYTVAVALNGKVKRFF